MTTLHLSPTSLASSRPVRARAADRSRAAVVGLLFFVATVGFGTADALISSILDEPGYLVGASAHRGVLAAATLLALVEGVAIVAIAVLMYPVLRRHREQSLGMAYVACRVAELAATLVYLAVPLVVVQLGDGSLSSSTAGNLEGLFPAQHNAAIVVVYLVSSIGGSALAVALLRSRLVPRAIALLGVVGYPVLLAGSALAVFGIGDVSHGLGMLALAPGGLFEVVLPLWLLIKGFRTHVRN
jgi:uncharacterized protein DUF4386